MARLAIVCLVGLIACLAVPSQSAPTTQAQAPAPAQPVTEQSSDQIPLSAILPKLEAIHEDTKTLLIRNRELKAKILVGLQAQNEAKLKQAKELKLTNGPAAAPGSPAQSTQSSSVPTIGAKPQIREQPNNAIDYSELEEFNKWVEHNLEYAVKNTQASAEALKEEAQHNNGNVDYSEQAIKDGIEGVKYWQSAVIFQDKTLKFEKYEVE